MDIDNIKDINVLRDLLKSDMVQLTEAIETPTRTYNKGEWFFCVQDEDGVWIYDKSDGVGLQLTYDEAYEYIRRN